eukprot:GEMP01077393.1.p1 GENE.GEMP01077393.1~~GEMP01077393.1.p1  ORF type:complete len:123 (-),score=9.00 GEMP01077393.1:335-703(-)
MLQDTINYNLNQLESYRILFTAFLEQQVAKHSSHIVRLVEISGELMVKVGRFALFGHVAAVLIHQVRLDIAWRHQQERTKRDLHGREDKVVAKHIKYVDKWVVIPRATCGRNMSSKKLDSFV